jgi:Tol biopolymer transport system component/type II secretory pathway pseudopilin PulG
LIELLVVILIIGILIAVSAPSFLGQTQKAHDSEAKQYLTVAYRNAVASATDRDGAFVQGSFTAADLAIAIHASEPGLTVAAGACPASADADPKHIFIDSTTTTASDLTLCNDPTHRVWTLKVLNHVLQPFGAPEVVALPTGGGGGGGGGGGASEGPPAAAPGDISQISQDGTGNGLSGDNFSTPFSWTSAGVVFEDDSNWSGGSGATIVFVDPITGAKTPVPGAPVPAFAPVASPDGTKIAFTDGNPDLYVYDVSTHTSTLVASGLTSRWIAKSWSPDGLKLAWTDGANNGSANLFYATADGATGAVNLTDTATTNEGIDNESGAWPPAWAPTSDKIAYSRNGNIRVSTLSGTLSTLVAHAGGFYTFPTWSSNGTLAFLSDLPSSGFDVITANASGGAVSTLTHIPSSFSYDPMLSFNADNSYLGAVFKDNVSGDDDVFAIKLADGSVTDLTPSAGTGAGSCCSGVVGAYSWSPSGHWIAYVGNPGDLYEVKVY